MYRNGPEKRPLLLRTHVNVAGTTETAKVNLGQSLQPPHTISQNRPKVSSFSFVHTLTHFTTSNQYYFMVLMLVIAWRKLERGSIKCSSLPKNTGLYRFYETVPLSIPYRISLLVLNFSHYQAYNSHPTLF